MSAHIGAPPEGFEVPVHRALVEPILLGGVPRTIAIVNGTAAAALGLGLQQWIAGLALWALGHTRGATPTSRPYLRVTFARRDTGRASAPRIPPPRRPAR